MLHASVILVRDILPLVKPPMTEPKGCLCVKCPKN